MEYLIEYRWRLKKGREWGLWGCYESKEQRDKRFEELSARANGYLEYRKAEEE